jgi:hypothetical protein
MKTATITVTMLAIIIPQFVGIPTNSASTVDKPVPTNNANTVDRPLVARPDDPIDRLLLQAASIVAKTLPQQLDDTTRLDTVMAMHRRMVYNLTIIGLHSGGVRPDPNSQAVLDTKAKIKRSIDTDPDPDIAWFKQNHITMAYDCYDEDRNYLYECSFHL